MSPRGFLEGPGHSRQPHTARRRFLNAGAGAVGALASLSWLAPPSRAAHADLLRILCSGPAGSIPDLVARGVADQVAALSARRALVDNRPGAAGQLSVAALKAADADGSTLLLAQGAVATVYPSLYAKLAYDPVTDLQPVTLASEMLLGLAVGPAVPGDVTTLSELAAWLRRYPDQANVGSPGIGTLPHLLAAMWLRQEGIAWQHVAYTGGPPAVTALLGGQIAALVLPEGLLRVHQMPGRLRVLATSGAARSAYLPGAPTFAEQGHADLVVKEWFAFFAPPRVLQATVESVSALLREAIGRPELAAAFAPAGMTPAACVPSALAARIASEQRYWRTVVRAHAITVD